MRPLAKSLLALVLALAVAAVFSPALRNGFVWDDNPYVVGNPHVRGGLTAGNLRWALTSFEQGNWHPLTWVSHMLDAELFGLDPRGHHAVNVIVHAANALLLFLLLRSLTGAVWRSFLAAAVFALHPLRAESVAWVAERKDVLSSLFGMLALAAYRGYVSRPGPRRYAAILVLFGASLAAKPMLVTLPAVLLLLDFWPLGRLGGVSWRQHALEKAPLLGLSAAASAATFLAQASAGYYNEFPLGARLSNAAVAYVRYLGRTALPADLAAFYPHTMDALPLWQSGGALLVLAAATVAAVLLRRRQPYLLTGWLWYLGTLVPVIGLVQAGQQASADRYTYLPLVGAVTAAVWAAGASVGGRPAWRAPLAAGALAALLALSAMTVVQVGYWRNSITLYSHAIAAAPGNWFAHYNLGAHLWNHGRPEEAAEHYREALRYRPGYPSALNNLGMIALDRGETVRAVNYFKAAIRSSPGFADAFVNLGAAYQKLGHPRDAEAAYRAALQRDPASVEARRNLAALLERTRRAPGVASTVDKP